MYTTCFWIQSLLYWKRKSECWSSFQEKNVEKVVTNLLPFQKQLNLILVNNFLPFHFETNLIKYPYITSAISNSWVIILILYTAIIQDNDLLLHVLSLRISIQHQVLELSIIYKTYKKGKKKNPKTKYKQHRRLNCTERLIVSISKNSTEHWLYKTSLKVSH